MHRCIDCKLNQVKKAVRKNGTSNLNSTNSTSYLEEVQGTPERKQGGASFNTGSTLRSGQRGRPQETFVIFRLHG